MNAAWGGVYAPNKIVLCLSSHKTTDNIIATKAFTVSFGDVKNLLASDYVGLVSANDAPDKMEKAGLHTKKAQFVNAPVIEEFPVTLECKFLNNEDGNLIGEIVNASADESVLGEDGNIDFGKLNLIIFDPIGAAYRAVGKKVGSAFSDGNRLK